MQCGGSQVGISVTFLSSTTFLTRAPGWSAGQFLTLRRQEVRSCSFHRAHSPGLSERVNPDGQTQNRGLPWPRRMDNSTFAPGSKPSRGPLSTEPLPPIRQIRAGTRSNPPKGKIHAPSVIGQSDITSTSMSEGAWAGALSRRDAPICSAQETRRASSLQVSFQSISLVFYC